MKKYIQNTFLFLLPISVGILVLMLVPPNTKRAFYYLNNDCDGRGAWVYKRLYESEKPIDIAFVGSSHTINGINDSLIEKNIGKPVVNLGYCRHGRNLNYVIIKHILQAKKPSYIVLEVNEDEQTFGHPIFPYLANGKEVISTPTWKNKTYPEDLYKSIMARITYCQQNTWDKKYEYVYDLKSEFGFSTNNFAADTNFLAQKKAERDGKPKDEHNETRNFAMKFPRAYLQQIADECKKYNTELIFVFMPAYGSPHKLPNELETYSRYGKTLVPPDSIYNDKNNWYDDEHLNKTGADKLGIWLIEEFEDLYKAI